MHTIEKMPQTVETELIMLFDTITHMIEHCNIPSVLNDDELLNGPSEVLERECDDWRDFHKIIKNTALKKRFISKLIIDLEYSLETLILTHRVANDTDYLKTKNKIITELNILYEKYNKTVNDIISFKMIGDPTCTNLDLIFNNKTNYEDNLNNLHIIICDEKDIKNIKKKQKIAEYIITIEYELETNFLSSRFKTGIYGDFSNCSSLFMLERYVSVCKYKLKNKYTQKLMFGMLNVLYKKYNNIIEDMINSNFNNIKLDYKECYEEPTKEDSEIIKNYISEFTAILEKKLINN